MQTRPTAHDEIVIPVQPEAGRWWVVPLLVLLTLLLAVVMLVAFALIRYQVAKRAALAQVKDEVARIQAAGEPVTIEDLYAYREVKAGVRDTTALWLAALDSFHEQQLGIDGKALPFVGALSAEGNSARLRADADESLYSEAQDFLANHAGTVQATLVAAQEPGECRFPVKFEDGVTTQVPHLQKLRSLARIFQLRLHVQKSNGDIDGALESLTTLFAIPGTLQHEALLIGHAVRSGLSGVAQHETAELLSEVQLTDAQLAELEKLVRGDDLQAGLTAGLIGERAMNYHTFHHLETIESELPIPMASRGSLTRPADCLLSLELLGSMIEASREPFPAAQRNVEVANNRIKAIVGSGNPLEKWTYMITALMMPAVGNGFVNTSNAIGRQRALLAAIAAERHRLASGSYPAKLSDLVPAQLPAVPLDPFDGQPLRLVLKPDEILIYSIGRNQLDDGGNAQQLGSFNPADIVVRVRAVKGADQAMTEGQTATGKLPTGK